MAMAASNFKLVLVVMPHTTGDTQTHTETASDMVFQMNHLQLSPRSSLHTPLMPNTPDQELLLMVNTLCSAHCMVPDVPLYCLHAFCCKLDLRSPVCTHVVRCFARIDVQRSAVAFIWWENRQFNSCRKHIC